MSGDTLLVLLEFTGVSPAQTLRHAIPDRPKERTLVIDPISFIPNTGYQPLSETASEIMARIASRGVDRVAMAGSCVAANLLRPVASHLAAVGCQLPIVSVIAPQVVTQDEFQRAVARVFRNLGCATDQLPYGITEASRSPHPEVVLKNVSELIEGWLRQYFDDAGYGNLEEDELCQELLQRYGRWLSLLQSCMHYAHQSPMAETVDLFIGREDAEVAQRTWGAQANYHTYEVADNIALLQDPRLKTDLREILGRAGCVL
jgi:hypothetical protein